MDLFGLIVEYLYTYIFNPMNEAFLGNSNAGRGLEAYYFAFIDGQFSIIGGDAVVRTLEDGTEIYYHSVNVMDFLAFISTVVIFILLFIVCVKFIVWLFKQISFITRF